MELSESQENLIDILKERKLEAEDALAVFLLCYHGGGTDKMIAYCKAHPEVTDISDLLQAAIEVNEIEPMEFEIVDDD